MKFCGECGKQIAGSKKFCGFCGATQPELSETSVTSSTPSESVLASTKAVPEPSIQSSETRPKKRTGMVIGLIIAGVIVLGGSGIGVALFATNQLSLSGGPDASTDSSSPSGSTTPQPTKPVAALPEECPVSEFGSERYALIKNDRTETTLDCMAGVPNSGSLDAALYELMNEDEWDARVVELKAEGAVLSEITYAEVIAVYTSTFEGIDGPMTKYSAHFPGITVTTTAYSQDSLTVFVNAIPGH